MESLDEESVRGNTTHQGQAHLINDWGVDLSSVTVRHRRGNDANRQEERPWTSVASGTTADGPLTFTWETGLTSPRDFWWVKFVARDGEVYACKDDFDCSLRASDDGNVWLTLDGADKKLHVKFSHSSGCTVALTRQEH